MVQKIKWTKRALYDLRDIYRFIAKDSPQYAQIQIEKIQRAVSHLVGFPLIGRHVPEFPHLPYREILVGNYRVLYRIDEEHSRIIIMSAVHGRRLIQKSPAE